MRSTHGTQRPDRTNWRPNDWTDFTASKGSVKGICLCQVLTWLLLEAYDGLIGVYWDARPPFVAKAEVARESGNVPCDDMTWTHVKITVKMWCDNLFVMWWNAFGILWKYIRDVVCKVLLWGTMRDVCSFQRVFWCAPIHLSHPSREEVLAERSLAGPPFAVTATARSLFPPQTRGIDSMLVSRSIDLWISKQQLFTFMPPCPNTAIDITLLLIHMASSFTELPQWVTELPQKHPNHSFSNIKPVGTWM